MRGAECSGNGKKKVVFFLTSLISFFFFLPTGCRSRMNKKLQLIVSAKFCGILNKCACVRLRERERKGGTGEFCLTSASVSKRSLRKMLSLAQANKFPHLASVSWTFSEFSSHHRLHKILPNKDWISCNTILKKKRKKEERGNVEMKRSWTSYYLKY